MISNIQIDLPRDFLSKGCQEYVLCLTRDGERALLSAKKKGIATWFDVYVWTWIRNFVSHFRTIPTISYTFQEILPALQSAQPHTTDLSDLLRGFNVTKYNTKHPEMSETFFLVFSALPCFPKNFEAFKTAKQPGKLDTAFTHFQQEIDTLSKEFDRQWPERRWETNRSHLTEVPTDFDLLRETIQSLHQHNKLGGKYMRTTQALLTSALTLTSHSKTSLDEKLSTIETTFGKEKIGILRQWLSDVNQCCLKVLRAMNVDLAVQYVR